MDVDKEHFLTVDETIIVRVGFVSVGEEVVCTCDDFLAVFQTIVIGVKHARTGGVSLTFPHEIITRFLQIGQSVRIRVWIGGVGTTE